MPDARIRRRIRAWKVDDMLAATRHQSEDVRASMRAAERARREGLSGGGSEWVLGLVFLALALATCHGLSKENKLIHAKPPVEVERVITD